MTDVSQVITVTVNVGDTRVQAAGFGIPLIFDLIADTVFPERVRSYTTLNAVGIDFAATTKVWKAASAIFAQARSPAVIKVGRRDVGDADEATALAAILIEDPDWYALIMAYKTSVIITAVAVWVEANGKIMLASSEDADVLTGVSTDVASLLQTSAYHRTAYMWHHAAGIDITAASYTVTSGVATVQRVAHTLRVGDPVTFSNSSGSSIDGNNTVASIVDDDNFTVATTAVDEAGPDTVDYFARYTFPEAAWAGTQLSTDPGSETWKFKLLAGIAPTPPTLLTSSQELLAKGKNANLYTTLGGVGHTHDGVMASGRFIDIERGIDWLDARIGEGIANRLLQEGKIPYSDAGGTILQGEIAAVLDQGVTNQLLGPLLDDSGNFYVITVPKVNDQLAADRTARHFPGITAQAQLAGAVHTLAITVNANI